MQSSQGNAFGSRILASARLLGTAFVCAVCACGPIGGVAGDDGTPAADQGGAGTGASGGAAPVVLPDPPAFKVIGYQPSWAGTVVGLQFDKLNYIDYAFAIEAADGSVTLPKPTSLLSSLVSKAHQSGVRVLLSVGGWNNGDDSAFNTLSATPMLAPSSRPRWTATSISTNSTASTSIGNSRKPPLRRATPR